MIPVYNNSDVLETSIKKQLNFYSQNLNEYDWKIVIVNNASTDNTLEIAKRLEKEHEKVEYMHFDEQGRGNALKHAWFNSDADFLSYMDVDLATDIKHVPELVGNLRDGYDLSVGSKYIPGAKHKRYLIRFILSRTFNKLNKFWFNANFTDAQCGFKALTKEAAVRVLPLVKDKNWFFDTELLVYAQRLGLRLKEVPVTWKEYGLASASGVRLISVCAQFLKKMIKLRFRRGL